MSKTTEKSPSLEEWRALYDAAIRIEALEPWEWMTEDEIFGVQDPETGEIGYVSITGTLGEHLSVTVYLGAQALHQFWFIETSQDVMALHPEKILEMPQIQVSFEDRSELSKEDHDIIKSLGLKFRGRMAWPMFRSIKPGHFPWYLTDWEARFLRHVLEQTLALAPRLLESPDLLLPEDEESDLYLVRVPRLEGDEMVWGDSWIAVPEPGSTISLVMDSDLLQSVKQLPRRNVSLEMDFFAILAQIQDKPGTRPFLPYMLLTVDHESGMILDSKLMLADPDLESMWAQIPLSIVELFAKLKGVPKTVYVRDHFLGSFLGTLTNELDFNMRVSPALRQLDSAKRFLIDRF